MVKLRKIFSRKADNETVAKIQGQHSVSCSVCGLNGFRVDRYKCLICNDYDLCAQCFEKRSHTKYHLTGHPMVHFKVPNELFGRKIKSKDEITINRMTHLYGDEQHDNIACNGCSINTIRGLRFKCDTCPNFNLCQTCAIDNSRILPHNLEHPLILVSLEVIQKLNVKDIECGDVLGKGAFGTVYKAKWLSKTGRRQVACKEIHILAGNDAHRLETSFLRELSAYAEVGGPYILKTFGYAYVQNTDNSIRYFLVMEYMTKGSLNNVIYNTQEHERLSFRRKLRIACDIASGMRKIHEHSIIHRDIRPDNILVTDDYLTKIGDMGIARVLDTDLNHTQIGCVRYMPPEFYDPGKYDQKLDIYTFGLTLNELFTETTHEYKRYRIELTKTSPIFSDLIERCIEQDPQYRPTAIEIETTLQLYMNEFNSRNSSNLNYSQLSLEEKNELFLKFYQEYHPEAVRLMKKQYPPIQKPLLPKVSTEKEEEDKSHTDCRCTIQ